VTLTRILLAVGALLVAAWLVVGLRSAVLTKRGTERFERALAAQQLTGPDARQAERDFDRATLLNPDRLPQGYRAQVLAGLGRREEARELVLRVSRDEPDSFEVWNTVRAVAISLDDRALVAASDRRLRRLNPRAASR
jgi:hypothetical protein